MTLFHYTILRNMGYVLSEVVTKDIPFVVGAFIYKPMFFMIVFLMFCYAHHVQ